MSRTIHLTCPGCRQTLWVAQHSASRGAWYIYGPEENRAAFNAFVNQHIGHPVVFQDSESVDFQFEDVTDYGEES